MTARTGVALGIVFLAFIAGAVAWRSNVPQPALPAPEPALPQFALAPTDTIEGFIEQLESESFRSIGLLKADVSDRELLLGWSGKWLQLPADYRRQVVQQIGDAWFLYYGTDVIVFAVPAGRELARYSSRRQE